MSTTSSRVANKHSAALLAALTAKSATQTAAVLVALYTDAYKATRPNIPKKPSTRDDSDDDDDDDDEDTPGLDGLTDEASSYASNLISWLGAAAVGYALSAIVDRIASDAATQGATAGITDAVVYTGGDSVRQVAEDGACQQCLDAAGTKDIDSDDLPPVHPSCGCEILEPHDNSTEQTSALGRHVRRWHTRDWEQWDLEHPYIPHPRESGSNPTSSLSAGTHLDTGPQWSNGDLRNMAKEAVKDAGTGGEHIFETEPTPGELKAAVATNIAGRMDPAVLDAAIDSSRLSGPMDDGWVYAGGFIANGSGSTKDVTTSTGASYTPVGAMDDKVETVKDALNNYNIVHRMSDGGASIGGVENPILGPKNQDEIAKMTLSTDGTYGVTRDATGRVTGALGGTPEARQMIRESVASSLVQTWAGSSNDSSATSLAMQESAVKEFGLTGTAKWDMGASTKHGVNEELASHGALYQNFLRSQYEETQQRFKDQGVSAVTVYRGAGAVSETEKQFVADEKNDGGKSVPIDSTLRPLSSWSTDNEVANRFASNAQGTIRNPEDGTLVYNAEVPVDRVLSTCASGFGCKNEYEVVVLGGTEHIEAYPFSRPDTRFEGEPSMLDTYYAKQEKKSAVFRAATPATDQQAQNDNEDWIKSIAWDLPTDFDGFRWAIGCINQPQDAQRAALEQFMTLPAASAMPAALKTQVNAALQTRALGRHVSRWARRDWASYDEEHPDNWAAWDEEHATANASWQSAVTSEVQKEALEDYTGFGYGGINGALRDPNYKTAVIGNGRDDGYNAQWDHLVNQGNAIHDSMRAMPDSATLYRGMGDQMFGGKDLHDPSNWSGLTGKIVQDNGFASTSHDEGIARSETGYVCAIISAPKGTMALNTQPYAANPDLNEKEVLLDRGTSFRIDRIEPPTHNRGPNVYMTVVHQDGK